MKKLRLVIGAAAIVAVTLGCWGIRTLLSSVSVPVLFGGVAKGVEDARLCGKVERYIDAVVRHDEPTALALWVLPDRPPKTVPLDRLAERRQAVTHNLATGSISSTFEIMDVEVWSPGCCENGPSVKADYGWAAGARIKVDLIDGPYWEPYFFDIFGDGGVSDPEGWVIRDVYPASPEQEPLFWRLRSAPAVQRLDPFP